VPDTVDPDLFTLFVTTTPMYEGTPLAGDDDDPQAPTSAAEATRIARRATAPTS